MTSIPTEISARHVHLTQADWAALFGYEPITAARSISQPPQFLAEQRVQLTGPKGRLDRVAIVGPLRPYTQVELAATEARALGLEPPLRVSGHLDGAATITMTGPHGSITVAAAILQQRHIHANPDAAATAGIIDGQEVRIQVNGPRGGILDHVQVRIDPSSTWRLHLDTDEANAFGLSAESHATIVAD